MRMTSPTPDPKPTRVEQFVKDCKDIRLETANDLRFTLGGKQMRMTRIQSNSHRIWILSDGEWNPVRGFEQREQMDLWDKLRAKVCNTMPGQLEHYGLWEEL